MKDQESFKPYIPAEKITAEMTATSVIMGIILSVVFGAANAYLGLRVGMTVSASIPAAVISMGVIRVLLKKNSILESNMVQTIGSAGESLAAGAIFTMPALFLWAKEGLCDKPSILEITLIALCGGILGVLFMVPLRNALIVKEHATLLYPEGTACADVLLAGEEGGANASTVFSGMSFGAAGMLPSTHTVSSTAHSSVRIHGIRPRLCLCFMLSAPVQRLRPESTARVVIFYRIDGYFATEIPYIRRRCVPDVSQPELDRCAKHYLR